MLNIYVMSWPFLSMTENCPKRKIAFTAGETAPDATGADFAVWHAGFASVLGALSCLWVERAFLRTDNVAATRARDEKMAVRARTSHFQKSMPDSSLSSYDIIISFPTAGAASAKALVTVCPSLLNSTVVQ